MVDRVYIPSRYTRQEVTRIASELMQHSVVCSGVCVWDSVGAFAATLQQGDRVVVHSLGVFDGSVELLGALRLFFEAGATVYSVREEELSARLTALVVDALYAASVEGLLGQSAAAFSAVDPSIVERLARMERCIQTGVSVSEAARRTQCSRNVYYYYKRITAAAELSLPETESSVATPPVRRSVRTADPLWPEWSL